MLTSLVEACRQLQDLRFLTARCGNYSIESRFSFRKGASLVDDQGRDLLHAFQSLGALDQDTDPGPATGGGGGGGYPGTMYSSTSTWLTSETLSLTELMDAYNTQLVGNGWEQVTSETGDHISLSLWTFSDEDTQWSGYFSLMESAAMDGDFYATIMVEQIEE